ncbi:MAG: MFS transporter [Microthrixaceae bacterium]|nr:MFS transporter [Microthrixaceae bacterium]
MSSGPEIRSGNALAEATVALRNREFRIFWLAALISNTGGWMQSAAIPFVVYELTGRNAGVGVAGFWAYIPIMIMGVVGGSLADRFDRKRLLVVMQIGQAVFAVGLWVVVANGWATPARLSALAFGSGLASGLNIPVWQSFVAQLVPKEILLNAVTLNSTQFNAARALGTFLAGVIVVVSGAELAFAINAVSFGAVLVGLAMIRTPRRRPDPIDRSHVLADLMAGFRYVRDTPGIVSCCAAIAAIAGLASPLFSFLPASYGQDVFNVADWRLGLLQGGGGIGAILLAPLILTVGARLSRKRLLVIAMASHGLATAAVGVAPNWWIAVVALAVYGGAYLAIASALNTTIQLLARESMRGKAVAIFVMCLTGALPLGLMAWGWAADAWGIRPVTVVAGLALVTTTAWFSVAGRFDAMAAAD